MIKVRIDRDKSRNIVGIHMAGHAGYAEEGSDIVCSAASILLYTAANSLEIICGMQDTAVIVPDDGSGDVRGSVAIKPTTDAEAFNRAQVVMATIETGLISLATSVNTDGNRYIEITEGNYSENLEV